MGKYWKGILFAWIFKQKGFPFFVRRNIFGKRCAPLYIPSSLITPLPFGEGLGVRLFLYPSCLKDFLFGIVDFLELAFGSPFDIVAKGGYTVGMMLESKLAVGSLDLLVGG